MQQKLTTNEMIKQALIAVLIGALINFIGQLSAGLIDILRNLPIDEAAIGAGVGKYLWAIKDKIPYV